MARATPPSGPRALACVGALVAALALLRAGAAQPQSPPPPSPGHGTPSPSVPPPAPEADDARAEVEVVFVDGRRVSGELVSQDQSQVVVLLAGIETRFDRAQVDRVRILPSVEERYASLRQAIDDSDVPGRLQLVDWLRDHGRYELALKELEGVRLLAPAHPGVAEQTRLIAQLKHLRDTSGKPSRPRPGAGARRDRPRRPEFPLLTPDQINLMRVFEVDLNDPPPLAIEREAIERLMKDYADRDGMPRTAEARDAFLRRRPAEILSTIFRFRARELYPEVRVLDHPRAVKLFRDSVHSTWLVNGCATAACHGGENAGRLYLATARPNSDATLYTNLLILDRFKLKNDLPLIDYVEPSRSPLLQAGLPRDQSLFPHPDVEVGPTHAVWRPVFQGESDRRFVDGVEWINAMFRPRSAYPIPYTPPSAKATAPPAPPAGDPATPPKPR